MSSELQVELLESSFELVKPKANDFAASFYENLFTDYPAAKPLFENTDVKEQSKKLLASLVFVVENLKKPDALVGALKGLGARHVQYGALPEHYPLVGSSLLKTFEQYLGDDWTPETKQAWVDAYGVIAEVMLDGADYSDAEVALDSDGADEPAPIPEPTPEPTLGSIPEPTPEPMEEVDEATGLKVALLESSFEKVKPVADDFVASFYDNLFTDYPAAKPLFAHSDMKTQGGKLLKSLVFVVENLRRPGELTGALKGLGARHVKYGALPEHYPLVGSSLLKTFEQYLKADWTGPTKQAWVDAYGLITEVMLEGADYSQSEVALKSVESDSVPASESAAPESSVVAAPIPESVTASAPEPPEEPTTPVPDPMDEVDDAPGLKVALLESSFEKVKPVADDFVASFYDNLFTDYPAAKPLFAHSDMKTQGGKLLKSLVFVVENLRRPGELTGALKGLGARHVKYGALPEHYPLVGSSLLKTFEQYLKTDWTEPTKQAWVDAYGLITEVMLEGADYSKEDVKLDAVASPPSLEESPTLVPGPSATSFVGGLAGALGILTILFLILL